MNDRLEEQSKHFNKYVALARDFGVKYPSGWYALIVEGDCMNNGGIADCDVLIMQPSAPKNGDVVDAIIKGKGAMVKRYHVLEDGSAVLRADGPLQYECPVTEDITFRGVMVGLIRGAFRREGKESAPWSSFAQSVQPLKRRSD